MSFLLPVAHLVLYTHMSCFFLLDFKGLQHSAAAELLYVSYVLMGVECGSILGGCSYMLHVASFCKKEKFSA